MSVLVRILVLWLAASFAFCGLYSAARSRKFETLVYAVATVSVFVMVVRS